MPLLISISLCVSGPSSTNKYLYSTYQPQGTLITPVAGRKRTVVAWPNLDLVDLTRLVLALERAGVSNVIKPC